MSYNNSDPSLLKGSQGQEVGTEAIMRITRAYAGAKRMRGSTTLRYEYVADAKTEVWRLVL